MKGNPPMLTQNSVQAAMHLARGTTQLHVSMPTKYRIPLRPMIKMIYTELHSILPLFRHSHSMYVCSDTVAPDYTQITGFIFQIQTRYI